jgi:beta-glucosidase
MNQDDTTTTKETTSTCSPVSTTTTMDDSTASPPADDNSHHHHDDKERRTDSTGTSTASSRIKRMIRNMSVDDKIAQLAQVDLNQMLFHGTDDHYYLYTERAEYFFGTLGVGSLLNTPPQEPWLAEKYRDAMRQINNITQTYKRPPVIWGLDSIHGANYIHGASLTPQPINLAATFNVTQAYEAGRLASRDTRAAGVAWLFSPLVDVAMDPRWSRVFETFGEDPHTVGVMAQAMTHGIQIIDEGVPRQAAASAKHFIAYSKPWNGHDRSPSWIPTRHVYQYFVPPWQRVLAAHSTSPLAAASLTTTLPYSTQAYQPPMTVMESYTEYNGVPTVAHRAALEYLLRHRLDYEGVLVTDYSEMRNLATWHRIQPTVEDAQVYAMQQGTVDMSMVPIEMDNFIASMRQGVESGQVSMGRLHQSVERILRLKEQLGLLDDAFTMEHPHLDKIGTDDELCLDMARESLILAYNKEHTLPLMWDAKSSSSTTSSKTKAATTIQSMTSSQNQSNNDTSKMKVLVTGPTAASLVYQSGAWTWQWQGIKNEPDEINKWFTRGTTVLEAIMAESHMQVSYACGVDINGNNCQDAEQVHNANILEQLESWVLGDNDKAVSKIDSINKAVQQAKDQDVVIVCVGEPSDTEKPGDKRTMDLAMGQYELVRALKQGTRANIVLVYLGGRTRLLYDMVDNVDAVILGFLPGPTAGTAVADVLTGRYNPSGRLPVTYPLYTDLGGIPYYHAVSDRCTKSDNVYDNEPCKVQWPFGHGLSYTTFDYSDLKASGGNGRDLVMSVKVTNSGNREGAEAVMFFTFDESRLVTPEYKRLRAFEKVRLAPGESQTVNVMVPASELEFVGPDDETHYVVQPDMRFHVGVGYETDCREKPDDALCVMVEPIGATERYSGACQAACDLWQRSECAFTAGMTPGRCMDLCTASGKYSPQFLDVEKDGWGWNYVNCLESVVWSFEQGNTRRCEYMTTLCRDVFQTNGLNEFGIGSSSSIANPTLPFVAEDAIMGSIVAFSAAALVSMFVFFIARGGFRKNGDSVVQFTPVRTEPTEIN